MRLEHAVLKYDTGSLPELADLQASDRVLAIHKEYIGAGAKIIRTNTFAVIPCVSWGGI